MRQRNVKPMRLKTSDFTSISGTVDVGDRAEIEVFRGAPSTQYPNEGFFLSCRKAGTKGAFLKVDAEGLIELRKWINGSEFSDILARVKASESGRSTTVVAPAATVNPPAAGVDDQIAALVNAGLTVEAARLHLGIAASPATGRHPSQMKTADILAELNSPIWAGLDRAVLVAALVNARS